MAGILTLASLAQDDELGRKVRGEIVVNISIRSITSLLWGIPRVACRPALNDEVKVRLRVIFYVYFVFSLHKKREETCFVSLDRDETHFERVS